MVIKFEVANDSNKAPKIKTEKPGVVKKIGDIFINEKNNLGNSLKI